MSPKNLFRILDKNCACIIFILFCSLIKLVTISQLMCPQTTICRLNINIKKAQKTIDIDRERQTDRGERDRQTERETGSESLGEKKRERQETR